MHFRAVGFSEHSTNSAAQNIHSVIIAALQLDQGQLMHTFTCGQCHVESKLGVHVCVGCQGDVVYGATMEERKQGAMLGGIAGFMLAFAVLDWIPKKLSSLAGTSTSFLNLPSVLVFAGIGALAGVYVTHRVKAPLIRTFRQRRVH